MERETNTNYSGKKKIVAVIEVCPHTRNLAKETFTETDVTSKLSAYSFC